ncbi:MetQ/NlpA family ABC transporter substrate-binding protein [Luteibacter sp. NPDC031894]|uniref:MetQ/NlpA family ABC transporter substrate-binding protein n=1 Tax=Luteibacter sp. NPDC031894 TaxID=3390572 RepID=UPI003D031923
MKKTLLPLISALAVLMAGCSGGQGEGKDAGAEATLTVAATPVPHTEILKEIKPLLAKQGVKLEIRVFTDYVQPNMQVAQKQLDVNFFETGPYLDAFNKERGTNLVKVVGVHIEPFGAYSRKYTTIDQLPDGANVVIPNDPSNNSRALLLLAKHHLITLANPDDKLATLKDITGNPKHLKFRELEAAMLPRVLGEVDLALINTNYALAAKLNPVKDALLIEDKDSPYVNFLVARPDNKDDPRVQKLAAALTSPEVKAFIEKTYGGAVQPAF